MFTIYTKEVGGRVFDRYYKNWDNAKKELASELEVMVADGWIIRHKTEEPNEYGFSGQTQTGEDFSFYLHEGCFQN